MFSQFTKRLQDGLEAVEQGVISVTERAAQPPERPATPKAHQGRNGPSAAGADPLNASTSPKPSTSSVADNALSSLRRTLRTGPSSSVSSPDRVKSPPNNAAERELAPVRKGSTTSSRLDERLRASLKQSALGSSSGSPSAPVAEPPQPASVQRATPASLLNESATDPLSIPLPPSPTIAEIPIVPLTESAVSDPLSASAISESTSANGDHAASHARRLSSPMVSPRPQGSGHFNRSSVALAVDGLRPLDAESSLPLPSDPSTQPQQAGIQDASIQSPDSGFQSVIEANTGINTLTDVKSLEEWFKDNEVLAKQAAAEIAKLRSHLRQQEERIEELHDTHRLESASRTAQLDELREQLKAQPAPSISGGTGSAATSNEIAALKSQVEASQRKAKEEEEKTVKAVTLLKTLRAKSVRIEKELADVMQERSLVRDDFNKDRAKWNQEKDSMIKEKSTWEAEQRRLVIEREIDRETLRREMIGETTRMKKEMEENVAALRSRLDREVDAVKKTRESEMAQLKSTHSAESTALAQQISKLEGAQKSLSSERENLFDQLQLRQAEIESSQYHLESLQNQMSELRHQLREAEERSNTLSASSTSVLLSPGLSSPPEAAQAELMADMERRYEAKLSESRAKLRAMEAERTETEEEWSRNLQQRSREIERLRGELSTWEGEKGQSTGEKEELKAELKLARGELEEARSEVFEHGREISTLKSVIERTKDAETRHDFEKTKLTEQIKVLLQSAADHTVRDSQLKDSNKALRDELKKLQSSATLLDRQRGQGTWSNNVRPQTSTASSEMTAVTSNGVTTGSSSADVENKAVSNGAREDGVNLEYLRNIIMQFLEHKEMRPDLVRVMSVILKFTPAETRLLTSKVSAV